MCERNSACESLCERARQAHAEGRCEQASRLTDAAIRQQAVDSEARRELAELLWAQERRDDALQEMLKLRDDLPLDAGVTARLAEWYAALGYPDDAYAAAQDSLAIDPRQLSALYVTAQIAEEQSRLTAALEGYQQILEIDPYSHQALLAQGRIYTRQERPENAAPLFRRVADSRTATREQRQQALAGAAGAYANLSRPVDARRALEDAARLGPLPAREQQLLAQYRESGVSLAQALAEQTAEPARVTPASAQRQ